MKDLVILVADKNIEYTVQGLLGRPHDLGIRDIEWDLFVHPRRDPGCLNEAHEFLRPMTRDYAYALVLFDRHGCGRENDPSDALSDRVRSRLARNGWPERAEVVVLDPELEAWVWSPSPHVEECLGWTHQHPPLREWLAEQGYWPRQTPKPPDPKAAMEAVLRQVRKPRSSAIYLDLARQVSLHGCTDAAFRRFGETLRRWFPL